MAVLHLLVSIWIHIIVQALVQNSDFMVWGMSVVVQGSDRLAQIQVFHLNRAFYLCHFGLQNVPCLGTADNTQFQYLKAC